jgi:molybdopterin-guanine dinucleotide biosynthesis protein A
MAKAALSRQAIAGVILAGGASRRMGGGDKSLQPLGGRLLLAHVVDRLRPQVAGLVLNANGDRARFAAFGLPVVADATAVLAGPLAGLLAGMTWAREARARWPWIATMPADTPFFPADFVARLSAAITGERTIAVARSRGEIHPVAALFPTALADDIATRLASSDDRSVKAWLATQSTVAVDFPDTASGGDPFFNLNTPEDLAEAERMVGTAGSPR